MKTMKCWLTVEGIRTGSGSNNVYKVVAKRLNQTKPDNVSADQEAIEIVIDFPDDYFDTNSPKVHITVPKPPQAQAPTATVQATVKPKAPSAAAAIIHGN